MTNSSLKVLLSTSVLATGVIIPTFAWSQGDIEDCGPTTSGALLEECVQDNQNLLVRVPSPSNVEPEVAPATNSSGFSISLDGRPVDSDPTVEDQVRRIDLALEDANVQVSFDGLTPTPRLGLEVVGQPRAYRAGDSVTMQSETNYPAFINRAEFRVIDRSAVGGPRVLQVVPVEANGQASFVVPSGENVVVVHRVYGQHGRFDETAALPLGRPDDRGLLDDVEELDNAAVERNIKVRGGAVTIYADGLTSGSRVAALGTSARPDASGAVVIERILPPGQHDVTVRVSGEQHANITRPVDVPNAEWFYVAVADLTIERVEEGDQRETRTIGRFQYYVDGRTSSGVEITSSLDTGEEELEDVFRRLDEKDPRSVLERIDPEDSFPTFGDDSEIVDNTPTSGRFYLRVAQDNNRFVWGDFQSTISGNTFVRNERTLYGAQAVLESKESTANGDARVSLQLYGAQPDQLAGRETFRGTGGSVYFLRRQDITQGTETISIEVRDAVTGLVVDQRRLVAGRDYDVNYLQGVVTLTSPLTNSTNNNLIQSNPGGDQTVNLVVSYEYTPTTSDVDGFSYGGRFEAWADDQWRFGLSATSDDTGAGDHQTIGADIRYQFSENTFVQLDAARSEGPGIVQDVSVDGGLTINSLPEPTGSGVAYRLAGQADLRDLGYERDGVVGGYAEFREEGFSSLDYSVTAATGDETFYGVYARVEKTDTQAGWAVYADIYENNVGVERTEVGVEVEGNINESLSYIVGAEYLDQRTATTDGSRFDVAGRLEWQAQPNLTYYAYAQGTVSSDDLEDYNRIGIGFTRDINDVWSVAAEISGGTGGVGGRLLAEYSDENGNSTYFGYELDAGRDVVAGVTSEDNRGRYLVGGRRQISDTVAIFGENTYDLFSSRRTLTSAYGLEYQPTEFLSYDVSIELGQVAGTAADNLDRVAFSFGARYEDEDLSASGRIELRRDRAEPGSSFNDFDAIFLTSNVRYKIDEEQRVVFRFSAADSDSDESSILNGTLVDAELGYAYRPIWDERLNVLARYRYLRDLFGQEIDGVDSDRIRQESHVFSVEASYDLNRAWTLGTSIGGRFTESSAGLGQPFTSNDAWLGVVNVRYHLVHAWDLLAEVRHFELTDAEVAETSVLLGAYRHIGNNVKIGAGYNFGTFSDDLTDLTRDDQGAFINLIAKF